MSLRSTERAPLSEKTLNAFREVERVRLLVRGAMFRHDLCSLRNAAITLAAAAQALAAAAREEANAGHPQIAA